jgi:hypothetical protein
MQIPILNKKIAVLILEHGDATKLPRINAFIYPFILSIARIGVGLS